jgi:hypothetical protein
VVGLRKEEIINAVVELHQMIEKIACDPDRLQTTEAHRLRIEVRKLNEFYMGINGR